MSATGRDVEFASRPGAALVTGGSGGLGAAICRLLAERGCDVALTFNRNEQRAAEVVSEVEATGRRATSHRIELTDERSIRELVEQTANTFGGIHTFVYASGPHVPLYYVSEIEPATFRRQMESDALAFFTVAHAVIPHLRETSGSIVAVTTVASRRFPPRDVLSSAPKGSVEAVVRAIAFEEGRYGVRANAVGPGIMSDGMTTRLVETGEITEGNMARTRDSIPLRRLGSALDIAEAVAFLVSDRANYITGQFIDVDGGYSL